MRNIDVNIGRRCNLRCIFCLDGGLGRDQRQWVPLERAREEVQRGYDQGCRSIGLLGGEPTVYPHLEPLLQFARDLGFTRMALYTNGVALGEPGRVDLLVRLGVTRVGMSIHSHTAELEDAFTGRAGSFEAKVRGLQRLAAHRRRGRLRDGLAVNPVVSRKNLPHLPAMARFFGRLGIDDLRFNFLRTEGRAAGRRDLTPRYRDAVKAAVAVIVANAKGPRRHVTFGEFPPCVWPWEILQNPRLRQQVIGERHDLHTDVALLGRPGHEDDEDLQRFNWAERRQAELKVKFPQCEGCAYVHECEGVYRTYVELYGDREFGAITAEGRRKRKSR